MKKQQIYQKMVDGISESTGYKWDYWRAQGGLITSGFTYINLKIPNFDKMSATERFEIKEKVAFGMGLETDNLTMRTVPTHPELVICRPVNSDTKVKFPTPPAPSVADPLLTKIAGMFSTPDDYFE